MVLPCCPVSLSRKDLNSVTMIIMEWLWKSICFSQLLCKRVIAIRWTFIPLTLTLTMRGTHENCMIFHQLVSVSLPSHQRLKRTKLAIPKTLHGCPASALYMLNMLTSLTVDYLRYSLHRTSCPWGWQPVHKAIGRGH